MLKSKWVWLLIVVYALLMGVSTYFRLTAPERSFPQSKESVQVSIDGQPEIRVAFKEFLPQEPKGLPIVMIHGSPGSAEAFDGLTKLLPQRHVISVDLPGFGDSETSIPDYFSLRSLFR